MPTERKAMMVSARLPASLVARIDFITKNTEGDVRNRSDALRCALECWLPGQENEIGKRLGTPIKKGG